MDNQHNLPSFYLDSEIDKNFSHTLPFYDLAGKFLFQKNAKSFANADAADMEFSRVVEGVDISFDVSVTASNIERKTATGSERVFMFPGIRECVIEEVLVKMATEHRGITYQASESYSKKPRNHVRHLIALSFSIYELAKELKRVGKTMSYPQIYEGLEVLSKSQLTFTSRCNRIDVSAPFLPVFIRANESGLSSNTDSRCFICFHPMMSISIEQLSFRRYNYMKSISFTNNYTRLIYKRLLHRWHFANASKPYTVLQSTLIAAIKTPNKRVCKDKELLIRVFEDLITNRVLMDYEIEAKKRGRAIIDWKYTLWSSPLFAKEQAIANKVQNRLLDYADA